MRTITCMGCKSVIATAESSAEAVEIAIEEKEARFWEEASEFECATCYQGRAAEFRVWFDRERRVLEAEALVKKAEQDQDDFLGRADMMRDIARDK